MEIRFRLGHVELECESGRRLFRIEGGLMEFAMRGVQG
jgi:hypothetical protein